MRVRGESRGIHNLLRTVAGDALHAYLADPAEQPVRKSARQCDKQRKKQRHGDASPQAGHGAAALCQVIPQITAGTLTPQPQDHAAATQAPMLTKEMAEFRFAEDAAHIHNWVRGMNPWPVAWFDHGGRRVKVQSCRLAESQGQPAGTVLSTRPLVVACGSGAVELCRVVPEGSRPMDGTAWAAGLRLTAGDIL